MTVLPVKVLFASMLVAGCGGVTHADAPMLVDGGAAVPKLPDAAAVESGGSPGRPVKAYGKCGSSDTCESGAEPSWHGTTCICEPRCEDSDIFSFGAASCAAAPAGSSPPYCTVFKRCELPCETFGSSNGCPDGLACGVTLQGLRCITTREVVEEFARPDSRSTIRDFELYGACNTFEEPKCPRNAMGTGRAFMNASECFCSALCFEDGDCPAPPVGYGRAACLRYDLSRVLPESAGYCTLICDDSTSTFPCPAGLTCRAPPPAACTTSLFDKPSGNLSVCRGGHYHHGDGDAVIEPGEAYAVHRPPSPTCDPNVSPSSNGECDGTCDRELVWSSDGRCYGSWCCSDADCPAPPDGYPPATCAVSDNHCHLSCKTDADCQAGGRCVDVDSRLAGAQLGCD